MKDYPVIFENGKRVDGCPNTAGIYCWENIVTGKKYVGKTLSFYKRMRDYRGGAFSSQRIFYRAVQKYGLENFTCRKICDCCPEELNALEIHWIKELGTLSPGGYNLNTGGGGVVKHSDEAKKKMSDARRGMKLSPEHRANIGLASRNISPETRRKLSLAAKGKKRPPRSAETRANMRKSNLLRCGTLWKEFFVFGSKAFQRTDKTLGVLVDAIETLPVTATIGELKKVLAEDMDTVNKDEVEEIQRKLGW